MVATAGHPRFRAKLPLGRWLAVGVTGLTSLALARSYDFGDAASKMREIELSAALGCFVVLATGLLVSSLRHGAVMAALGLRIPFALAFRSNVFGILGGLMLMQMLGQTLARSAVLARHGVGGAAVLMANAYERLIALASLLTLSLVAALYLHGGVSLDIGKGGALLLKLGLGLVACGITLLLVVPEVRRALDHVLKAAWRQGALGLVGHSLVLHGTTLAAFMVLGHELAPEIPLGSLAAASVIVMLAASLPISFAGWGVRELSAVHAYQLIGMSAEKALAISIVVGVVSLVAVLLLSAVACVAATPVTMSGAAASDIRRMNGWSKNLTVRAAIYVPPLVAALIFFQIHLPVLSGGVVNVNLADPIAILGGVVFASLLRRRSPRGRAWVSGSLCLWLAAFAAVLCLGFLIGWARHGFVEWAFFNRLLGFGILLGYLASGALILFVSAPAWRSVILRTLVVTGFAVIAVDIGLLVAALFGMPVASLVPAIGGGITGLSQNTNAFALQIVILLAVLIAAGGGLSARGRADQYAGLLFAALLLGLYLARSRTGYVAGAAVIGLAISLGWLKARTLMRPGLLVVCVLAVAAFLGGGPWGAAAPAGHVNGAELTWLKPRVFDASSDGERWRSLMGGFALWREYPIFGAGLGAFGARVRAETGTDLIIHSTGVWTLAELGIVGVFVLAGTVGTLARNAWRHHASNAAARLVILVLAACVVFQSAHDIFSQRLVWFVLGLSLAAWPIGTNAARPTKVSELGTGAAK